jgi:hypothetical protein
LLPIFACRLAQHCLNITAMPASFQSFELELNRPVSQGAFASTRLTAEERRGAGTRQESSFTEIRLLWLWDFNAYPEGYQHGLGRNIPHDAGD